jgi:hypothetical protein
MKQKRLPKYFFPFITVVSMTAFLFVNVHSGNSTQKNLFTSEIAPAQVEHDEDEKAYEVKVPDISLLGRVLDIAQKLLPVAH